MTTQLLEVRPLPQNAIVKVSGVSFRQDAVRKLVEYSEVRIRHDQANPHDPNACEVVTLEGEALGFVPKELAVRLSGPTPGGVWRARVEEVLRGDTWGLRVRVGPLIARGSADRTATMPGLRHRGDGVVTSPNGAVALSPVDDSSATARPSEMTHPQEGPDARKVYAKSGRLLGDLLDIEGRTAHVRTTAGRRASYPLAVVIVRDA